MFTLEQVQVLFSALEAVRGQIIELGEMEQGSEPQREVLQNITRLLSKLDEEKTIYQLIILPLLNTMRSFERSLFIENKMIEKKNDFEVIPDKEKAAENELAKQLISQMFEASEKVDGHVNRLEKILKTDVQNLSSIQDKPLEEKTSNKAEIAEINAEPIIKYN